MVLISSKTAKIDQARDSSLVPSTNIQACLKAFERYSGKKTCPMCRRDQYETRVIHEGAKRHRDNSATRSGKHFFTSNLFVLT